MIFLARNIDRNFTIIIQFLSTISSLFVIMMNLLHPKDAAKGEKTRAMYVVFICYTVVI